MPQKKRLMDAAAVFGALGDATRLALLGRLAAGGPMSIAQLTAGSTVTRQAITKHLHVLAKAGLVRDSWRGRERLFELVPHRLEDAKRSIDEVAALR